MKTADLPADVTLLIRRGRELQAERDAEKRRALAAAEEESAKEMARLTAEVRAAFTGLPTALAGCVLLRFTTPEAIKANGQAEAWAEFPGCTPIRVHFERAGDGWRVGRAGERDPYRVRDGERYATLAEATAAARRLWIENQPVPEGLS